MAIVENRDPFPPTGLVSPAFVWVFVSSFIFTCYSVQLISLGGVFFSEEKQRSSGSGGEKSGSAGKIGGGGKYFQNIVYEREINFKKETN